MEKEGLKRSLALFEALGVALDSLTGKTDCHQQLTLDSVNEGMATQNPFTF